MATAIVVGVSTGAMKPVLEKLATLMGDEFSKLKNLRKDVKFLSEELTSMEAVLKKLADMDELDPQTQQWRNNVRNMSYDIENIIDDFKRKIGKKNEKDGIAKKTTRLLRTCRARHKIAGQIKEIKKLVCGTSERQKRYEFVPPPSNDVTTDPRVATLYEKAARIVGVEGPTVELINRLNDEEKHLKVVSIVGFGGLGKTTLANEIYRQLKEGFQSCAFVPVTQKHNIPKLLRSLLSELVGSSQDCKENVLPGKSSQENVLPDKYSQENVLLTKFSLDCEENVLINQLGEYLKTKRYLIVIDDLWEELPWKIIKGAFPDNGFGSRVITTTRIHDVAKACCSNPHDYILEMKPLSNKDSRKLFFGRIFNSEETCPSQLRDVSTEILKKCGGMPLSIISISGMLVRKPTDQEEWERIRNSLGSGTNLPLEGMMKILNLSYKNLPPHLKTCLLYLGMYPEDFKIPKHQLELQWIAEGFISIEKEQDVEKVARSYFDELINRSLIEPIEFDNHGLVTKCKVHDITRDLILRKCEEENFLTVVVHPQDIAELDNTVHRLSLQCNCPSDAEMLPGNASLSQVRTFMIFGDLWYVPPLSLFKFLRVLYVEEAILCGDHNNTALGKMHQLRYLAMTSSRFYVYLAAQIRGLLHLETLDIPHSSLPSGTFSLPCLMFVNAVWYRWPDGIGNMKSLRYVQGFDLIESSLETIEGLGELTSLRVLVVYGWWSDAVSIRRRMDALHSSLRKICISLEYLGLHIKGCMDALMSLSPAPRRLERLHMGDHTFFEKAPAWRDVPGSFFSKIPNWMGKLSNLKELVVNVLKADIGILAQLPALVLLRLYIRESVRECIVIKAEEFPVLKSFEIRLSSASYLEFHEDAMPKLQWLGLEFSVVGSHHAPAGIHHLSALEDFSAEIEYLASAYDNMQRAESALRTALDIHPKHPRIHIECFQHESAFFTM